jgi:hypothetical protein
MSDRPERLGVVSELSSESQQFRAISGGPAAIIWPHPGLGTVARSGDGFPGVSNEPIEVSKSLSELPFIRVAPSGNRFRSASASNLARDGRSN